MGTIILLLSTPRLALSQDMLLVIVHVEHYLVTLLNKTCFSDSENRY